MVVFAPNDDYKSFGYADYFYMSIEASSSVKFEIKPRFPPPRLNQAELALKAKMEHLLKVS